MLGPMNAMLVVIILSLCILLCVRRFWFWMPERLPGGRPEPDPLKLELVGVLTCLVVVVLRCGTGETVPSEPSGLAASSYHSDVFWTHDDSGGDAELFAVNREGTLLGAFKVVGANAIDWEALASDGKGTLFVADVGNNQNRRRDLVVYQVAEPRFDLSDEVVTGSTSVQKSIRFFYPEQLAVPDESAKNFDAEALFWDAGRLYLLTKHRSDMSTTLYALPDEESVPPLPARKIAVFDVGGNPENFGGRVTGADLSVDGRFLAVLTYHAIFIFHRPSSGENFISNLIHRIDLDQEVCGQIEGIAWDGEALLFNNEDGDVFRVTSPLTHNETFP